LVYLGAICGGLFSGVQLFTNTFYASAEKRSSLIKVWGIFYSSLGALFCIWGTIAMLTSAPFDNWWHSAYGLDVQILSPPHSLLFLGIFSLQLGACISILKHINETPSGEKPSVTLQFLFILAASSFLCMVYTLNNAFLHTRSMRKDSFYQAVALITLLLLPALGRALRMKWGMTLIALGYFLIAEITNITLQLFPAEPKLGPILTHITHFQPANFPLLIIVPALLMDLVMQKMLINDWRKSVLISLIFVLLILAIQYPLSGFLLESPGARNWFFGAETWYFGTSPDAPFRYKFRPNDLQPLLSFTRGIVIAIFIGLMVSRLSLRWGNWMTRIQR